MVFDGHALPTSSVEINMAVSRTILTRGREVRADEFLEKIDGGDRIAMDVKDVKSYGAESFTGNIPYFQLDLHKLTTADETDASAEPTVLADLEQMRFKLSKRTAPMTYTWRSTAHEELHFIHRGRARFLTELGELEAKPGRFIHIGRGVRYRVVPESKDFFDFILESQIELRPSEHWHTVDLQVVRPTFPLTDVEKPEQISWEERINGLDWTANVKRRYDPLGVKDIVGSHDLVYAIDMDAIPNDVPGTHRPLRLFANSMMELDISKQGAGEGPPFYHRNNVRNEIHFVHAGDADQKTELGYIDAPAGTMFCMPYGIEHTFGTRETAPATLLFETKGTIKLAEGVK